MEVICFQFPHFPSFGLPHPKFLRNHSCVSCHGGASCLQSGTDPVSQERQPVCGQRVKSTVSPGNPDFTATDPFAKKHKIQNHCKWRDSSLGSSYHPADQNVFWKLYAGTKWIYFWDSEGSMCLEMKESRFCQEWEVGGWALSPWQNNGVMTRPRQPMVSRCSLLLCPRDFYSAAENPSREVRPQFR